MGSGDGDCRLRSGNECWISSEIRLLRNRYLQFLQIGILQCFSRHTDWQLEVAAETWRNDNILINFG